jgi:hypothetical protein
MNILYNTGEPFCYFYLSAVLRFFIFSLFYLHAVPCHR